MPITLNVDPVARVVRVRGAGRLRRDELIESLHRMVEDPAFEPAMPQLFDLRDVIDVDASSDEIRDIVERAADLAPRIGAEKLALVAGAPVIYGLSRMYEVYAEKLPVTVKTFYDYDEAVRWLGMAPEPGPPS